LKGPFIGGYTVASLALRVADVKSDVTKGDVQLEKKSAGKSHVDKQLDDARTTNLELVGKKALKKNLSIRGPAIHRV
jgi:hypothetical protein